MNIHIANKEDLENKIERLKENGSSSIHIVSDFDRTLTRAFVNGKKVNALISVLRNENYLTEEYSKEAHKLADKYHPIEMDPNIPLVEKKKAMLKWWTKHFELLIRSKLNIKDIERAVNSEWIKLREGTTQFIDILKKYKIPLIIFSSAGLGTDSIKLYLEKERRLYPNVYIVSNAFEWDSEGYAVRIKKPIIHIFNKDETSLKTLPIYSKIEHRKNIILLGDNIEDIGMINGIEYQTLLKIGFLNENVERDLQRFLDNYDIVITNDGPMTYVNKILKQILRK